MSIPPSPTLSGRNEHDLSIREKSLFINQIRSLNYLKCQKINRSWKWFMFVYNERVNLHLSDFCELNLHYITLNVTSLFGR